MQKNDKIKRCPKCGYELEIKYHKTKIRRPFSRYECDDCGYHGAHIKKGP